MIMNSVCLLTFYCFLHRLPVESLEDLLSMSPTVFDQLTPLSANFYKLCTCNDTKTHCSYKQHTECKTNVRGREYHCVLHSSSRRKRDLNLLTRFQRDIEITTEEVGVSLYLPVFKGVFFKYNLI